MFYVYEGTTICMTNTVTCVCKNRFRTNNLCMAVGQYLQDKCFVYMRGQIFVGQMFYVYEGTNIYRTNTVTCVCDNSCRTSNLCTQYVQLEKYLQDNNLFMCSGIHISCAEGHLQQLQDRRIQNISFNKYSTTLKVSI